MCITCTFFDTEKFWSTHKISTIFCFRQYELSSKIPWDFSQLFLMLIFTHVLWYIVHSISISVSCTTRIISISFFRYREVNIYFIFFRRCISKLLSLFYVLFSNVNALVLITKEAFSSQMLLLRTFFCFSLNKVYSATPDFHQSCRRSSICMTTIKMTVGFGSLNQRWIIFKTKSIYRWHESALNNSAVSNGWFLLYQYLHFILDLLIDSIQGLKRSLCELQSLFVN